MSKIVLLSPPYLDLYGPINSAAGRYFPLGLGYIASYLKKYGGHDVRMYEPEAQSMSLQDLMKQIQAFRPNVVGITSATPNFDRALDLAKAVKTVSEAKVVLGGVHATALSEFIIERHGDVFDVIVVGEGEETMLELVSAMDSASPLKSVKGIVFRDRQEIIRTGERPFIADLDIIPVPARELINQKLFYPNLHNSRYRNSMSILTSRGCPFNCSFCASRIVSGRTYRTHSAEYVLEEMSMLKRDFGAQQLLITDDTFTLDSERLESICRGMIDRRLNLAWFCFSQVTTVNRETLTMMKKAGCYNICFGIESGDEAVLKSIGKPVTAKQAISAVQLARAAGMKTQASYILGLPGETIEDMKSTIKFAREVDSTLAFFNMLVPYPGTREFTHYYGSSPLDTINWRNFIAIGEHSSIGTPSVTADELQKLVAKANTEYYLRPLKLLDICRGIRTPHEFYSYIKGFSGLGRQVISWLGY